MAPTKLDPAGLPPEVVSALEAAIARRGRGSPTFDAVRPPIAVFDWDNTCIFNDIGDATFDRTVTRLDLRFTAGELAALIPESLGGRPRRDPILRYLEAGRSGYKEAATDFRAEMLALYDDMGRTDGPLNRYRWVATILGGRTDAELEALGEATVEDGLREPLSIERVRDRDGHVDVKVARGLRLFAPIVRLQASLRAAGFAVHVVSASVQPIVRAFARRAGFAPEDVIGVRLAPDPATGRLEPRILEPFPYAEGKVAAIDELIGRTPVLVAGDSPGDLAMLRVSADVRLVVERSASSEPGRIARAEGWLIAQASEMLQASAVVS